MVNYKFTETVMIEFQVYIVPTPVPLPMSKSLRQCPQVTLESHPQLRHFFLSHCPSVPCPNLSPNICPSGRFPTEILLLFLSTAVGHLIFPCEVSISLFSKSIHVEANPSLYRKKVRYQGTKKVYNLSKPTLEVIIEEYLG